MNGTALTSDRRLAWAFTAPAVSVIALIAIFPLAWTVWNSFHLQDLRMPWLGRPFIGLGNYLELARLQPGMEIQEGRSFDPTKSRYTGVSMGSRNGREARITIDGIDAVDEHVGDLLGLLHRRLDAVQAELVGRLLRVVDDVVERARERVHVGGVERRAARSGARQAAEVSLLLAEQDVAREGRLLGIVREQVAEQERDALDVARGLLEQRQQLGIRLGLGRPHPARH